MDVNDLKELLADACQDTLDDLDEVEVTKKGLRLTFMSGDQFAIKIEALSDDDSDDDDDYVDDGESDHE